MGLAALLAPALSVGAAGVVQRAGGVIRHLSREGCENPKDFGVKGDEAIVPSEMAEVNTFDKNWAGRHG